MRTLKISLLAISMLALLGSCEKKLFPGSTTTSCGACNPSSSNIGVGEIIEIDDSEYYRHLLDGTINKIVIQDGNGTIHITQGRQPQIDLPGYWVKENGYNIVTVEGNTLTICNTFTDTYIRIPEFIELEIETGNSTVFIDRVFAKGNMDMDLGGNSTVSFVESEIETASSTTPFNLEMILRDNGTFIGAGIAINDVNLEIVQNGTFNGKDTDINLVDLEILGNGTFDNYGGSLKGLTFNIHRNGSIYADVMNEITGKILSNGSMHYKGDAAVSVEVSQQGTLVDEN